MVFNNVLKTQSLKLCVEEIVLKIHNSTHLNFDAIAIQGYSGSLVGSPVALELGKELIVVRKRHDGREAHDNPKSFGRVVSPFIFTTPFKYIILDDLCQSGATIRSIIKEIHEIHTSAKFVGTYLYAGHKFYDADSTRQVLRDAI